MFMHVHMLYMHTYCMHACMHTGSGISYSKTITWSGATNHGYKSRCGHIHRQHNNCCWTEGGSPLQVWEHQAASGVQQDWRPSNIPKLIPTWKNIPRIWWAFMAFFKLNSYWNFSKYRFSTNWTRNCWVCSDLSGSKGTCADNYLWCRVYFEIIIICIHSFYLLMEK